MSATDFNVFPTDISVARARGVLQLSRSSITRMWTARIPLAGWEQSARGREELFEPIRHALEHHGLLV